MLTLVKSNFPNAFAVEVFFFLLIFTDDFRRSQLACVAFSRPAIEALESSNRYSGRKFFFLLEKQFMNKSTRKTGRNVLKVLSECDARVACEAPDHFFFFFAVLANKGVEGRGLLLNNWLALPSQSEMYP